MLRLLWIWPPPVMKPAAFLKLVKLHAMVAPGVTVALQLVDPNGTKSGLGPSVTVKLPGGRPVNVTEPLPVMLVPVVVIVAVALTAPVKLVVHITEPTAVKLEGTLSLTVKLAPGASPVKLPVRVIVVPGPLPPTSTVEPLVPPLPVSEKVKLPVPPSTCLVTTI